MIKLTREQIAAQIYYVFIIKEYPRAARSAETNTMSTYNKTQGTGCAVGCFLTNATCENFEKIGEINGMYAIDNIVFKLRTPNYLAHDIANVPEVVEFFSDMQFWKELQRWHDFELVAPHAIANFLHICYTFNVNINKMLEIAYATTKIKEYL